MSKCLVTKLSGSSSNTGLLKIGEMRIKFDKVAAPSINTQAFSLKVNKPVKIEIIGDGYFTDKTLSVNKGTWQTLTTESSDFFVSSNTTEVAILDKYALTSVRVDYSGQASSTIDGSNKILSIDDLKYSTNISYIYLAGTQTTGSIESLRNLIAFGYLNLKDTKVTGSIDSLKNLTNLTILSLDNDTQITGDISNLKNLTNLTSLYFNNTKVTGDISNLKNLTNLTSLYFNNTKVTGDISNLKNLTKVKDMRFANCILTGDLATLPADCKYISASGNSVFTWSTRPSSSKIIAMAGSFKVINLDKMLQDLAQCEIGFTESSSIGDKAIFVKGTRTSASDAAVSTLQSNGYTVTIISE